MDIEYIFYTGIILFSLSSFFFLVKSPKKFNTPLLVSGITLVSYIILLDASFVTVSEDLEIIYYTRWFFYVLSCTLLVFEMARYLSKDWASTSNVIYLTAFVMITGMLSAISFDNYKIAFFIISSIAYFALIKQLVFESDKNDPISSTIKGYVLVAWSAFPLVFLFSPAGIGLIGVSLSQGLYLILDLITKVAFYIQTGLYKGSREEIVNKKIL